MELSTFVGDITPAIGEALCDGVVPPATQVEHPLLAKGVDDHSPRSGRRIMNKVGIYYAYWTHDWNAAFLPYVAKVKRLGFDLLEVNSGTVTRMTVLDRKMCLPGPAIAGFDPDWMVSQGLGASKTRLSKQDGRI